MRRLAPWAACFSLWRAGSLTKSSPTIAVGAAAPSAGADLGASRRLTDVAKFLHQTAEAVDGGMVWYLAMTRAIDSLTTIEPPRRF